MTDIALLPPDVHCSDGGFDLSVESADLVTDDGLETAIIVSLFSDARAAPDERPDGDAEPRGWWGDIGEDLPVGSKLWTLQREKSLNSVAVRAEEYTREALQWLVDDGVISALNVTAEIQDRDTVAINIELTREGDRPAFRYFLNWNQQLAEF